ncbi:MAG TPA: type II toxin-antitoxin system prevent-host-death family antitoxin [Paraburkholderia sp.]|uniref:type II toxin-antitoxin system prevent-host-death family antitoxin n=1 Tax=Paraburkholderia sp. TaxID=1926495 RepID=UPI002B4A18FE|nr:type II toxin-antitoxin system prevent-host-death family antitoxin [Paraburkholderia sp.]HKR46785.1 type II toxin-antitoxin system prevent-host-death family antitoxin [Paraburkholderia sp.]
MNGHVIFSIAHLRTHAEELVAAVHGSNQVVFISDHGTPKAVLQDVGSFQSLQQAVNLLERLMADDANALGGRLSEIREVLGSLKADGSTQFRS